MVGSAGASVAMMYVFVVTLVSTLLILVLAPLQARVGF